MVTGAYADERQLIVMLVSRARLRFINHSPLSRALLSLLRSFSLAEFNFCPAAHKFIYLGRFSRHEPRRRRVVLARRRSSSAFWRLSEEDVHAELNQWAISVIFLCDYNKIMVISSKYTSVCPKILTHLYSDNWVAVNIVMSNIVLFWARSELITGDKPTIIRTICTRVIHSFQFYCIHNNYY